MTDQPPSQEPFQPYPQEAANREYDAAAPPTEQPPSIRTAVMLMRVGAVLSAVYLVATLIFIGSLRDDMRAQLQKSDADYTQSQLDTALSVYVGTLVILGLIVIALWLWMASRTGRARGGLEPWPRSSVRSRFCSPC